MTESQHPLFPRPGFAIGSLSLASRVLMAPMMGYNEPVLRRLARRFEAGLCVTEMIKPEQLEQPNKTLRRELSIGPGERPVGAQISGRDPAPALRAATALRAMGFELIDLNFGCPLKKECARGRGAAMMREPRLVYELVRALVRELDCPVTVKLRAGWSDDQPTAPEIARVAVDAGAAAVCVHGRSKLGWYRTVNDLDVIRRTREAIPSHPFIANGDVVDGASARRMIRETGADAVMVGRGAVGNPWLFQRVQRCLMGVTPPPLPDFFELRRVYLEHAEGVISCMGARTGLRLARKYAFFYFARFLDSARREQLGRARSLEHVRELIDALREVTPSMEESTLAAMRE